MGKDQLIEKFYSFKDELVRVLIEQKNDAEDFHEKQFLIRVYEYIKSHQFTQGFFENNDIDPEDAKEIRNKIREKYKKEAEEKKRIKREQKAKEAEQRKFEEWYRIRQEHERQMMLKNQQEQNQPQPVQQPEEEEKVYDMNNNPNIVNYSSPQPVNEDTIIEV